MADKIDEKSQQRSKSNESCVKSICLFTHAHAPHMHLLISRAPDYQSKTHACALLLRHLHNTAAKPTSFI